MVSRPRWFRFGIRTLFVVVTLAALAACWFSAMRYEYVKELRAIEHMNEIAPNLMVYQKYAGPGWMYRSGFRPNWLNRVHAVDVNGTMLGQKIPTVGREIQFEFDDAEFEAIRGDLQKFRRMKKLYLAFTEMTDESIPALMQFEQVDFLNLGQSAMTSEAVRKLEKALPGTKVHFFHGTDQLGNPVPPASDVGSMDVEK